MEKGKGKLGKDSNQFKHLKWPAIILIIIIILLVLLLDHFYRTGKI